MASATTSKKASKKASTVWHWDLTASMKRPYPARMRALLDAAGAAEGFGEGDLTALKLHFGEAGTTAFLRPIWMEPIVAYLREQGALPFFTDASTLYVGRRGEGVSHAMLAQRHGFDPLALGAPVLIADGVRGTNERGIAVGGRSVDTAWIAGDIADADALVSLNHFKAHELAGYGGALKNIGMGCASKKGKMHQHLTTGPTPDPEACTGCGVCVAKCAGGALALDENQRITVDVEKCVGCGGCFLACRHGGLVIDWKTDVDAFLARMMEYTKAVLSCFTRPCLHLNFVLDVVPDCDCPGFTDRPICPDLGILASWDPVAVDQAAMDMVSAAAPLPGSRLPEGTKPGDNKFLALRPERPEHLGLDHAEALGLGSRSYEIVAV